MIRKIVYNKLFKETSWSFLSKIVALVLFFLINVFLARSLGVEMFGLWSFFLSVITLVSVVSYFGVNDSTKKFVAQYNKTNSLRGVLISSLKLRFLFSLLFSLILLLFYKQLVLILNRPGLEVLFLYGIPLVFLTGLAEYLKAVFIGLHRLKYNFIMSASEYGLKLGLIILFFLFSNTLISIINSFVIAMVITTLIGFYLLYFNFYKEIPESNKKFTKEILAYSYPFIFISFGFLALTELNTIMIGLFSTTTEVGIYAIANQITKLSQVSLAISMGIMPIFAKLNKKNKKELGKKFYAVLKINLLLSLLIVLTVLFLSPVFVPLIFGDKYISSVLPMQILSIYLLISSTSIILSSLLDYLGKAKIRAVNISITIILNITLNLLLIPKYGAIGAAIAVSTSYLPYLILNWLEVKKQFN